MLRKISDREVYKIDLSTTQEELNYFVGKTIDARFFLLGGIDASYSGNTTFNVDKIERDRAHPWSLWIYESTGDKYRSIENPIIKISTEESPSLY